MKLPKSYYNMLSFAGTLIAAVSLFIILFLMAITAIYQDSSTYLGLFTFIILPAVMIIGLLMIPLGMRRANKRAKEKHEELQGKWMVFDFNKKEHRNAAAIFITGTVILILLSSIGSYEAYHFTESEKFCGTMCHDVMGPEYTTYQNSGHAKVACVECHIGSGIDWYVKSKMSGMRQVYSVLFDKYSRPIATPIHNLRPSKETCEECHWPEKFYSHQLKYQKHFLSDEKNTEWNIQMSMKVGSDHASKNLEEGTHWHMNPNVKIEYVASPDRQTIPWVKYTNLETGDTIVYENMMDQLTPDSLSHLDRRTMDCMDCHNRPAHKYLSPYHIMDHLMAAGDVSAELPEIKMMGMSALVEEYSTSDSAVMAIEQSLREYYTGSYAEVLDTMPGALDKAIAAITREYQNNIFPEMKVRWDAYPENIGHKEFNGCFRCHGGTHESAEGHIISNDCNTCHTIMAQGTRDSMQVALANKGLEFWHPVDIDGAWKEMLCSDCHNGMY
ncbi:cytochrome c3 family protein [Carboxylicivirga marina]|uniref:NapC/NirT family cytochrome c n=1 Tax=Carboxylicivirga marina TaxID=2800988 RepID=A0ABS1HDW8_9BACT|nr:NapC/NirT family cytochrome c [Carboxylicivirga marina]MBK3515873.1 NapC/NirT family cytochrome c [Carboxylicivirga marina]